MKTKKNINKKHLLLLFYIGDKKYAIDATIIEEIVPLVELEHISETSSKIEGHINYRGTMIPVIDLAQQLIGQASKKLLSTRIIIINTDETINQQKQMGLIAEKITETKHIDANNIKYPVLDDSEDSLNGILYEKEGIIRRLKIESLLPKIKNNSSLNSISINHDL